VPVLYGGDGLLELPQMSMVVAEAWPAAASRRVLSATVSVVEAVREDRCQASMLAPRYDSFCNWHPMGCLQV
jgi:hypothetical protein